MTSLNEFYFCPPRESESYILIHLRNLIKNVTEISEWWLFVVSDLSEISERYATPLLCNRFHLQLD